MSQYRGFGGGGDDLPDPKILLEQFKRNFRVILVGVIALVALIAMQGAVFTVQPEERAIILRFGKPIPGELEPGLHFKVPLVDQVHIVPVERQHRLEIGFRSEPGKVTTSFEAGYRIESLMLTGDLSLAHVRWSVMYRIKDLRHYLFNVKDPEDNVRDIAKGVMRNVIGDYSLDEVLLGKYREISSEAKRLTQEALDEVDSGILISAVELQKSEVPQEAKEAFNDLNRSVADVKRQIVEAYARRKGVRGEAEKRRQTLIGAAEGRLAMTVQNATGEASAFEAKLTEYLRAPGITQQWLYMEAMERSLSRVKNKLVLPDDDSGVLKLLPLGDLNGAGALLPATPAARPKGGGR
ncbi:MAG: membrane protease subunit HflK [Myxococcota bacterium]|jgi:membrane protease subunit HflK